jgi:hypothetical protein
MRSILTVTLLAEFLLLGSGCSKRTPPENAINPLDRVNSSPSRPQNFLHKTFSVRRFAQFEFEVPPHTAIPRLTGIFKSAAPDHGDGSDHRNDVVFLLLNAEQFSDFSQGHMTGEALYSTEPTHNQEVDFLLPPTQQKPEKYYVIFRNGGGGVAVKHIEADFRLTFGY